MDQMLNFLKDKAKTTFDINNNNCVQFTNECWEVCYGRPWGKEFDPLMSLEEAGFDTAVDAIDSKLTRTDVASYGSLVALNLGSDNHLKGLVLGFCIGQFSVFLSEKGVRYIPTSKVNYSWK